MCHRIEGVTQSDSDGIRLTTLVLGATPRSFRGVQIRQIVQTLHGRRRSTQQSESGENMWVLLAGRGAHPLAELDRHFFIGGPHQARQLLRDTLDVTPQRHPVIIHPGALDPPKRRGTVTERGVHR